MVGSARLTAPARRHGEWVLLLAAVCIAAVACTRPVLDGAAIGALPVKNIRQTDATVFAGGQPDAEQLAELAALGVQHVVSLRAEQELNWDEAARVNELGMNFHRIPVRGVAGVNRDNAEAFAALMSDIGDEPVFVHCGSGNRVGAIVALREALLEGRATDAAVAEGKRWGLTRLEPAVREQLAN